LPIHWLAPGWPAGGAASFTGIAGRPAKRRILYRARRGVSGPCPCPRAARQRRLPQRRESPSPHGRGRRTPAQLALLHLRASDSARPAPSALGPARRVAMGPLAPPPGVRRPARTRHPLRNRCFHMRMDVSAICFLPSNH
jgi:hypothetical protein